MAEFGRLLAWVNENASSVLDDDRNQIMGIGIGRKSGGPIDADDELCLTGFVREKQTESRLSENHIPTFESAVAMAAGMSTSALQLELDVVEVGADFAAQPGLRVARSQRGQYGGIAPKLDLQKRFLDLRTGVGITNPMHGYPNYLSVGTLGLFVTDEDDRFYLISNNHVIAEENAANVGDAIVQPGTLDLTEIELDLLGSLPSLNTNLSIAELRAWKDIQFHGPAGIPFNEVDCALAELVPNGRSLADIGRVGMGGRIAGIGTVPVDPNTGAIMGSSRVYKAGRTTGWTEGDITNVAVVSDVTYATGKARFVGQIAITPTSDNQGTFSDGGDSGSAILNADHEVVALLFAGGPARTLANPIDRVLAELEAALSRGSLTIVK